MMFFLISFLFLFLMYSYIGFRTIKYFTDNFRNRVYLWVLLYFFSFMTHFYFFLAFNKIRFFWSDTFFWVTFISLGFFSIVFFSLLLRDIIVLNIFILEKIYLSINKKYSPKETLLEAEKIDRRRFLIKATNIGVLTSSAVLSGYGFYEATKEPVVKRVEIPVENLSDDVKGLRIVQVTDLHIGPSIKRRFVENVVKKVNGLSPDVIVITGDLVDGSVKRLMNDTAPISEFSAKYGTYFVTGNHEYYSGAISWLEEIDRLGIITLLNEHRIIKIKNDKILLAGVPDYRGGGFYKTHRPSPEKAVSGAPSGILKILLAHQPRSIFSASKAGFDIQISGHTHGGQYYPFKFFVKLSQPYIEGLHKYKNTWIYINRGTGYWGPPLRIGTEPEISEIILFRKV